MRLKRKVATLHHGGPTILVRRRRRPSVSDDLPDDVRVTLVSLLETAREAAREWDDDGVESAMDSAATVAWAELPEGDTRDRLVHGIDRVRTHARDDPETAVEYLRAMERLVDDE
jgi:hypothetical protein